MDKLTVTQADRDLRNALIDHWDDLPKAGIDELLAAHRNAKDVTRVKLLEDALMAVVEATRAYLPPDGIAAKECLSRILGATDNPTINPIIFEIEGRAALQEQSKCQ